MTRYLVTGGLGVVGSQFCRDMMAGEHEVIVIDSCRQPRNEWTQQSLQKFGPISVKRVALEKMEMSSLVELVEWADFILHAAAHTGIPHSADDPDDDWHSNVDATRHLLEALRRAKKKPPTVALSSVKPYKIPHFGIHEGETRYIFPDHNWTGLTELDVLEPDEPYAASKMAQSGLCMAYARTFDLPVTVLRCSNLYGPAPCHGPRHGWLTWFCISAALKIQIELQGTGLQVRDMLFTSDVTEAVLASFACMDRLKGHVFNIGGGLENTISCFEAAQTLVGLVGPELALRWGEGRKHEDLIVFANYSKFSKVTKWKPVIGTTSGITSILDWARRNESDLRTIYGT